MQLVKLTLNQGLALNLVGHKESFCIPQKVSLMEGLLPVTCAPD